MKIPSGLITFITRFGYFAKGAVYIAVGVLALEVAIGFRSQMGDTRGALEEIGRRPFGSTLLVIIAVGLLHYSAWKFVEAFKNPENLGKGRRMLDGASGVLHIYLALTAMRIFLSEFGVVGREKSGDQSARSLTSWLLAQPFGRELVGAAGLIAFGISINQVVVAYRATFREKLALGEMRTWQKIIVITLGRVGFCTRALLFALVGLFLVRAAANINPNNVGGMAKAFTTLLEQPSGPWLLGATAVGLISHGLFMWALIRYREVRET